MQKLLAETPVALFEACAESGVERIVHLSALGMESGINVPYFTTRKAADSALQALPSRVRWLCLRPSVIYGEDAESSKMFRLMAKLPLQALPMGGIQGLQPVHIDDICSAVTQWINDANAVTQTVDAVGAEATTMRDMLDSYRQQMHYRSALHLAIPSWAMSVVAKAGDYIPSSPMCCDTLQMLSVSNTADVTGFAKLLKHAPRSFREFI
jgi:nucleoside-diphosphate-sugar epimerase